MPREGLTHFPSAVTKPTLSGGLNPISCTSAAVISRKPGAALLLPVNRVDRKRGQIISHLLMVATLHFSWRPCNNLREPMPHRPGENQAVREPRWPSPENCFKSI
jgi:hypothetical protein